VRDYVCRWQNNLVGTKVADLPTPVIADMIDYLVRGDPINCGDCANRDAILERLRLELQIRAWGMRE
jgi:hypothetical protein